MITATFFIRESTISGFEIKGHSGSAEFGQDIVCAAVSSAAYMAANTVTEVMGLEAEAEVDDGYMYFTVTGGKAAEDIFRGLKLHLEGLSEQYPDFVKVTTEV